MFLVEKFVKNSCNLEYMFDSIILISKSEHLNITYVYDYNLTKKGDDMEKEERQKFIVYMPKSLHKKLKTLAFYENVNMQDVALRVFKEEFEKNKEVIDKIQKSIEELKE